MFNSWLFSSSFLTLEKNQTSIFAYFWNEYIFYKLERGYSIIIIILIIILTFISILDTWLQKYFTHAVICDNEVSVEKKIRDAFSMKTFFDHPSEEGSIDDGESYFWWVQCVTDLDKQCELLIFESILTPFEARIVFWWSWGSIEN